MARESDDPLLRGFQDPPSSARPRVWWHWMNANITREGIRLDLEWMKRVGLGGFQNFDAANPFAQFIPAGETGQALQSSSDGQRWTTIITVPGGGVAQHTLAFPQVTARFCRVAFTTLPPPPNRWFRPACWVPCGCCK